MYASYDDAYDSDERDFRQFSLTPFALHHELSLFVLKSPVECGPGMTGPAIVRIIVRDAH